MVSLDPSYSSRARGAAEAQARPPPALPGERGGRIGARGGVKRIKAKVREGRAGKRQESSRRSRRRTGRSWRVCPGLPSAAGKRSAGRQAQDLQARVRTAKRSKPVNKQSPVSDITQGEWREDLASAALRIAFVTTKLYRPWRQRVPYASMTRVSWTRWPIQV